MAYGDSSDYGQPGDPMVGNKVGGVNVFGGGLALYNSNGRLVGAIGVSGDTSCADHIIAWRTRRALNLDNVPAGVGNTDNVIHDIADRGGHPLSTSGFGHPECSPASTAAANALPTAFPVGPNP